MTGNRHQRLSLGATCARRPSACQRLGVLYEFEGGGIAIREGPIQLRKIGGGNAKKEMQKLWEKNCGAGTKPPEASRSNTTAQVAQNVSVSLQRWNKQDKPRAIVKKMAENCESAGNCE